MKRLLIHPIGLALLAVLSWSATAHGANYTFSLDGPNTAVNSDGDVIATVGSGTFSTGGGVNAHGHFTHRDSSGAVVARGRWTATAFVAFDTVGGPSPGFQTGVLDITVELSPVGGDAIANVPMRVVCDIPGFITGEPVGTTVGDFDVPTGGFTLFNLHQN